jgi:hypothetical protein
MCVHLRVTTMLLLLLTLDRTLLLITTQPIPHTSQAYFDVCDSDSDGELTFSEFLRFVDLCDLNPDDHISVEDELLEAAFTRIAAAASTTATTTPASGSGASPVQLISFRDACEYKVSRVKTVRCVTVQMRNCVACVALRCVIV